MGQTARIWEGLLQRVVEANRDIVGGKRLKGHLDRLAEKYPALRKVSVSEGGNISIPGEFPEDDAGLMTVCTILGALYWALDMFTGPTAAAERIRKPARAYIATLLPGAVLGLNKFLPKLRLERGGAEVATELEGDIGEGSDGADGSAGLDDSVDVVPRALDVSDGADGQPAADGAGDLAANAGAAAQLPGEELAAQFSGTVQWLGEPVPRGCSILIEGDAAAKERCSLHFLREGLEAGESALALIAYSPEEFRKRMAAAGLDTSGAEEEGRLRILDWSTFRERHIEDMEDEGSVMRLPMELPYVGSGMNIALQGLPDGASPRAFVNILPRALATVAIETVFNFVQVTILKFKKKQMTALFIMDEEKDPEKAAIRLSFHSWVEIKPGEGEKLNARVGGHLLAHKRKVLAPSDGGLAVESEEASAAEEPEPELSSTLLRRMDEWRSQGYLVSGLEDALRGSPSRAKAAFDDFGKVVERARVLRNELKILDLAGFEADATHVREMTNDVGRYEEAEKALGQLKLRIERKKHGAMLTQGKESALTAPARPAEAIPVQDGEPAAEGHLPDATLVGPDGLAGEERRREFIEAMDRWREEGFLVRSLEEACASDLESARRAILLFRVQVQRLRELSGEIGSFDHPALADRQQELSRMQKDVANIPQIESGLAELRSFWARLKEEERVRKEEERLHRAALSEKLFWWSSHGLAVERLEAAMAAGELATVEKELSDFEPKAQRLLKLREELAALDVSDFKEQAASLESKLDDTERLEETEAELEAFKEHLALHSSEAKARRQLREKIEKWKTDGFRVETLEKLLESGQTAADMEREFERFGGAVEALSAFSQALASLDMKGFEQRADELRRMLNDPSLLEECRRSIWRLQEDIARSRREESERAAARARIEQWHGLGLQTGGLAAMVDGDIGHLRKAMVDFQFEIHRHDELAQLLEPLLGTRHSEEALQLQKEMRDFSRLGELEDKALALLAKVEAQARESGRELHGEFERDLAVLEKLRMWINMGYHVRRLEGALKGEPGTLRGEADRLESDIEQLSKTASALEVLDTKGLDRELAHIRSMLNDPDKLPAVKALTENLRTDIARRKKEDDRRVLLRAVAKEWEKRGYDTAALQRSLEGELDKASEEFILFHTRLSAAETLHRRLELLEVFGFDAEAKGLRERLRDPSSLEEVRSKTDGLWKAVEDRGRERADRMLASRRRRAALKERLSGHMEKGLAVGRLEKALELAPDMAEAEFSRFEDELNRLGELERRLGSLEFPGFERELLSLRALIHDVDRINDIERGISALEERVEQARQNDERKREELNARRAEDDRRTALHKRLEERLNEWGSFGLNVDALRAALEQEPAGAARKFEDFENSLYRTEELRLQLHELRAKGAGDVSGAETLEKLLEDPLRLPQAERAFSEFRQRAESALRERDGEMLAYSKKIAQLREAGEDVSELERALERGPSEVRLAIQERERHIMKRDLQDTWKGIKSKLVAATASPQAGTSARPEGKIVKKRRKKNTQAG